MQKRRTHWRIYWCQTLSLKPVFPVVCDTLALQSLPCTMLCCLNILRGAPPLRFESPISTTERWRPVLVATPSYWRKRHRHTYGKPLSQQMTLPAVLSILWRMGTPPRCMIDSTPSDPSIFRCWWRMGSRQSTLLRSTSHTSSLEQCFKYLEKVWSSLSMEAVTLGNQQRAKSWPGSSAALLKSRLFSWNCSKRSLHKRQRQLPLTLLLPTTPHQESASGAYVVATAPHQQPSPVTDENAVVDVYDIQTRSVDIQVGHSSSAAPNLPPQGEPRKQGGRNHSSVQTTSKQCVGRRISADLYNWKNAPVCYWNDSSSGCHPCSWDITRPSCPVAVWTWKSRPIKVISVSLSMTAWFQGFSLLARQKWQRASIVKSSHIPSMHRVHDFLRKQNVFYLWEMMWLCATLLELHGKSEADSEQTCVIELWRSETVKCGRCSFFQTACCKYSNIEANGLSILNKLSTQDGDTRFVLARMTMSGALSKQSF